MTFSEYRASCACYQCRYGNLSSRPKSVFQNPAPNIPNTSHNFGSPITVPTVKTSGSTSYSQMKQSIPRKPLSATKNNTTVDINRLKSYTHQYGINQASPKMRVIQLQQAIRPSIYQRTYLPI